MHSKAPSAWLHGASAAAAAADAAAQSLSQSCTQSGSATDSCLLPFATSPDATMPLLRPPLFPDPACACATGVSTLVAEVFGGSGCKRERVGPHSSLAPKRRAVAPRGAAPPRRAAEHLRRWPYAGREPVAQRYFTADREQSRSAAFFGTRKFQ